MDTPTSARFDIFSPGFGMTTIGVGLACLAAAELAVALFGRAPAASVEAPKQESTYGSAVTAMVAADPFAEPDPQSAVGTGPGAPRSTARTLPPASGQLVGVAANPLPNGTAIFRLWSSGRVEAMITTEENTWGEWVVVAPGLSTDMRRPRPPANPENP